MSGSPLNVELATPKTASTGCQALRPMNSLAGAVLACTGRPHTLHCIMQSCLCGAGTMTSS